MTPARVGNRGPQSRSAQGVDRFYSVRSLSCCSLDRGDGAETERILEADVLTLSQAGGP